MKNFVFNLSIERRGATTLCKTSPRTESRTEDVRRDARSVRREEKILRLGHTKTFLKMFEPVLNKKTYNGFGLART